MARWRIGLLLVVLWAPGPARAADRRVTLLVPSTVAKSVAAMPEIAEPVDEAERRINGALRQLDAKVRDAAATCVQGGSRNASWQRKVDATMRGPGYLSLLITDDYYCDTAYPNHTVESITYDLRTGSPVDWTRLLPAALTGRVGLQEGGDGTRMASLASDALLSLYKASYHAPHGIPECTRTIAELEGDTPMMPWLDAKAAGLAVQFELPHAMEACAVPVVVPLAELRRRGASPTLIRAIEGAHGPG